MRLESGHYFGKTRLSSQIGDAGLAVTDYAPQEQPWHTHENPTFFVHLRGSHRDVLPRDSFDQPVLSIVYHPATVAHRSSVGPEGMTGLNIELTADWMKEHETLSPELGLERLIDDPHAACAAIKLLDAIAIENSPDRENALVDLTAAVSKDSFRNETLDWLERMTQFIEASPFDRITIKQIAREVGFHPVHLARLFHAIRGETLCSYLQKMRLRRATSLLLQGLTAGEAAADSGFGDQFYMSRCFRRQFGFTPKRVQDLKRILAA